MRILAILLASVVAASAQFGSEREMQQVCPNRSSSEINTAITDASTNETTFVFDGGTYGVTNSVSFSSNITVVVKPGTVFDVSSGAVMDFNTNYFAAGSVPVFIGAGTATGAVRTVYRWQEWGDSDRFNIGAGIVGGGGNTVLNDQNNTYAGGTVQTFALASATNLSLNGAAIDSWDDVSTLAVATNSKFAGYSAITLSTNMITTDHTAASTSVAVTNATFTSALDGATNTFTSLGKIADDGNGGTYTFDLSADYRGYAQMIVVANPANTEYVQGAISAQHNVPTYNANNLPVGGSVMTPIAFSTTGAGASYYLGGAGTTGADNYFCVITVPFEGRYVNFLVGSPNSVGNNQLTYKFATIKIWGVQL